MSNKLLSEAKCVVRKSQRETMWQVMERNRPELYKNINELIDAYNNGELPGIPTSAELYKFVDSRVADLNVIQHAFCRYVLERSRNVTR